MATNVAMGIQSALGRCNPKAIATERLMARAWITENKITGRLSFVEVMSVETSGKLGSWDLRPRRIHTTAVRAIHRAAPTSQAKACSHHPDVAAVRCRPAGSEMATRNQESSMSPAVNPCGPNLRERPAARVTTKAARTTIPQGPPPMANPRAVSAPPITPTAAIERKRRRYDPPGSLKAQQHGKNEAQPILFQADGGHHGQGNQHGDDDH